VIELEAKEIREFKEYKEISELLIIFPNLPKFPKREQSVQARSALFLIVIFLIAPTRAKMRNNVYIFLSTQQNPKKNRVFVIFFLTLRCYFRFIAELGYILRATNILFNQIKTHNYEKVFILFCSRDAFSGLR
jgi:hypothetical protein